jgi:hypothetical protein
MRHTTNLEWSYFDENDIREMIEEVQGAMKISIAFSIMKDTAEEQLPYLKSVERWTVLYGSLIKLLPDESFDDVQTMWMEARAYKLNEDYLQWLLDKKDIAPDLYTTLTHEKKEELRGEYLQLMNS